MCVCACACMYMCGCDQCVCACLCVHANGTRSFTNKDQDFHIEAPIGKYGSTEMSDYNKTSNNYILLACLHHWCSIFFKHLFFSPIACFDITILHISDISNFVGNRRWLC